jgi:hypothetical protein
MKRGKFFLITLFVLCLLSSSTYANTFLSNPYYDLSSTNLYDFSGGLKLNPLSIGIQPLDLGLTGSFYTPPMTTSSYTTPAFTSSFSRTAFSIPFGSIYKNPNISLYPYTSTFRSGIWGGTSSTPYIPTIMGTIASRSMPYSYDLFGVVSSGLASSRISPIGALGLGTSYFPSSIDRTSTIGRLPTSWAYSSTGSTDPWAVSSSALFGAGATFAGSSLPSVGTGSSSIGVPSYSSGYSGYSGGYSGGYGSYGGGYGSYGYGTYSGGGSGGSSSGGGTSTAFYEGEEGGSGTSVQSGTLTAGDIDDNLNLDSFLSYIDSILQSDSEYIFPSVTIADRVTLRILDPNGKGISNARVSILPEGETIPIIETFAGTNGIFYFFPALDGAGSETMFTVQIRPPESDTPSVNVALDLNNLTSDRTLDIVLDGAIQLLPGALDLMIVMDATGSMADELEYITTELEDIIAVIQGKHPEVSMRFVLLVYRDVGDEYVVRDFEFTDSLNVMQQRLSEQHAAGGGDYPEAVEQALAQAVSFQWSGGNTARLMFHVADAPPHDEFIKAASEEAKIARQMGIRIYSLSGSGVAEAAEFLMRSNACITQGRYLFLTDDSGVGNPHAEPSIPCYVVTRLDHLIVRVVDSELAGQRIEPEESEIVREVGTCVSGICVEEQVEEQ